jgi:hypothetical protein
MGPMLVWAALGAILLAAAALKAADRTGSAVALAAYGIPGRLATPAWAALIATEAALAAGMASGLAPAAYAAGLLLAGFLVVQLGALAQGGAGAPCGCFGGGGRLSRASAGRTALLAVACAAVPLIGPGPDVSLVVTGAVAAAVVVLAAGRQPAPRGALEVDGEGPALGERSPLAGWFERRPGDTGPALALFTSPGCALCKRVAPAAEALEGVEVRRFDEADDPEAWAAARVPGAPFAVALGPGGVVLAKGTVNDARQLESVLAAARARREPDDGAGTSRRAFLGRAGGAVAATAGAGMVGAVIRPGEADAYHFCGHIYTTDGCPHPTGLPRIDRRGLPLRARDGKRVDDLGRVIDDAGRPLDEDGKPLTDPDGRPLPAAPRTRVCKATGARFGIRVRTDGSWYRCCHGRVRKLVDCCAAHPVRINGDRSLKGYCFDNRKVFCVMYFQSTVPC